jgi:hypothetical protein
MATSQRLLPLAAAGRTYADRQHAVSGHDDHHIDVLRRAVNVLDDPAIEHGILELFAKRHPQVIQDLEEAEARANEDAETLANQVA